MTAFVVYRYTNIFRKWALSFLFSDLSGVSRTAQGMTCMGWSTDASSLSGLSVSHLGQYSERQCDELLSAACCGPIQ
jgi:hypothetical protein